MPPAMNWTAHPLTDESWMKSASLVTVILVVAATVTASFGGIIYGAIAIGILVASMSRYLLPTRYCLDDEGLTTSHLIWTRRCGWADFRRADIHRDGVFLSPFPKPTRLDPFRGLFIRCFENGGDVAAYVRSHVRS